MTTITPLLRIKERIIGPSGIYNIQSFGSDTPGGVS